MPWASASFSPLSLLRRSLLLPSPGLGLVQKILAPSENGISVTGDAQQDPAPPPARPKPYPNQAGKSCTSKLLLLLLKLTAFSLLQSED